MQFQVGDVGHLGVILSFIGALFGTFSFWLAYRNRHTSLQANSWSTLAKMFATVNTVGILTTVISLFVIIHSHRYEYYYAWAHSSNLLPVQYMISCFWEGQEGSFLLWLFWNSLTFWLFLVFSKPQSQLQPAVLMSVQVFLSIMILGVSLWGVKFGSSPFVLTKDAMASLPIYQLNPEFVPKDGRGLNPLLQNYWMVIHPPTLFLGFALSGIPFAVCLGYLLDGTTDIFRKSINRFWLLVATLVLGIGIMMGAYWAYETLNFGGYWNWDPVENAVYIPWLFLAASFHAYQLRKDKGKDSALAHALPITAFLLVLYSTFLTRSGILGDTSVHSFTDLGLSGQLLIFLLFYIGLTVFALVKRRQDMSSHISLDTLSDNQFWLTAGILCLALASFQVLISTSIPVYNEVGKLFGFDWKLAPPGNAIRHFTGWQMWFAAATAVLSAIGQALWYRRNGKEAAQNLLNAGIIALVLTTIAVVGLGVNQAPHIAFLALALWGLVGNIQILILVLKKRWSRAGSSLAHIGLAIMIVGILFSAGYDKVISLNRSGMVYKKEFSEEMNRDNILLWRNKPQVMGGYEVTFRNKQIETLSGQRVNFDSVFTEPGSSKAIYMGSKPIAEARKFGDSLTVRAENTYYEVVFRDTASGKLFTLHPRAQVNPNMGLLASPDIKIYPAMDLYAHVSSIPADNEPSAWENEELHTLAKGDTFFINDFVAVFRTIKLMDKVPGFEGRLDAAVEAEISIMAGNGQTITARPQFLLKGNEVGHVPAVINDMGFRISLEDIKPQENKFVFKTQTRQRDWIILKAVEKPLIGLVWGGFLIMMVGVSMAIASAIPTDSDKLPSATKPRRGAMAKV